MKGGNYSMIKFRQKMYIAPLAAAGLASKVGGWAMNGLNMAGQASMIGGVVQTNQQMKQAEQHQAENAKLQQQQIAAENKKAQAIQNLANSGNSSTLGAQAVQYAASDVRSSLKNQKFFAYTKGDVVGFAKDTGKHLYKNRKHIGSLATFGVAALGGKYLADKIIQKDKSIMPKEERAYSVMGSMSGLGIVAGIGALPVAANYLGDKLQQKSVSKKTEKFAKKKEKEEKSFSAIRRFGKKSLLALKRGAWGRKQNMNIINKINNGPESQISDPRTWHWLKKVRHNPVRGLANVYNSMSMMGGETGMASYKNSLVGQGSSGSKLSKDVANFMDNHGATSMAALGLIGGTALMKSSELIDKTSEKALRKIDKNAFKYSDSKEEEIR